MSLASRLDALITRIGAEFKDVRVELAGKSANGHTHDPAAPAAHATSHGSGGSDPVTPAAIGAAFAGHTHTPPAPYALSYAASLTPDLANGAVQVVTCTGNPTLNPPASPLDGQKLHVRFIASASSRVVTLAAGLSTRRIAGVPTSITIPAGYRGDALLHYEAADSGWSVLAFGARQ